MAFSLQRRYMTFFILRQHTGNDLRDMQPFADGFGCTLVVPCEHNNMDAHLVKEGNGGGAVFLFDVGSGDNTDNAAVISEDKGRLAVIGKAVQLVRNGSGREALFFEEPRIAGKVQLAIYDALNAAAKECFKIRNHDRPDLPARCVCRNGFG